MSTLKADEESVIKLPREEEGRIIAQSRFDVNEEIRLKEIFCVHDEDLC